MVTEEAYEAVIAENRRHAERIAELEAALAQALQRISELETKKTPPPAFVKANQPPRPVRERKKRAAEANHARRREAPTRTVEQAITHCPDCGGGLGGVHVGRVRQVVELPPPPPGEITAYQVQRGWCSTCGKWREARVDLSGQVLGQGRLGVGIAALVAHLRTVLRLPIRAIQTYLADVHDLRVRVGELVAVLQRVAAHGAGAVATIRARVRRRAVVRSGAWR